MINLTEEEKKAIEIVKTFERRRRTKNYNKIDIGDVEAIKTVLDLIKKQQKEIENKNKIINNSIMEIENFRQYFSEDLQPDFIRILEILKDKKVIDW